MIRNMKKTRLFILLILVIAISIITTACIKKTNKDRAGFVEIQGKKIYAEVASTPEQRARGLMYRKELCGECGMLFVFNQEDYYSFWMENTTIPLDIVFINSDLKVVEVIKAQPRIQDQGTCGIYIPENKARYVLETNQGMFDNNTVGEKAVINIMNMNSN